MNTRLCEAVSHGYSPADWSARLAADTRWLRSSAAPQHRSLSRLVLSFTEATRAKSKHPARNSAEGQGMLFPRLHLSSPFLMPSRRSRLSACPCPSQSRAHYLASSFAQNAVLHGVCKYCERQFQPFIQLAVQPLKTTGEAAFKEMASGRGSQTKHTYDIDIHATNMSRCNIQVQVQ